MKTSTIQLIKSALRDLQDVMDYVASESGDCNILNWLEPIERNLIEAIKRYREEDR